MKEKISITIPPSIIDKIITDYVIKTYGDVLGITHIDELEWNDYSLIKPSEGLEFSKKHL